MKVNGINLMKFTLKKFMTTTFECPGVGCFKVGVPRDMKILPAITRRLVGYPNEHFGYFAGNSKSPGYDF